MARSISKEFKKDLESGTLSAIMDEIKNNNKYIICFRDESINIYYRGHSLLFIKREPRKGYLASFDLGHARYYKEYFEIIQELKKLRIGGMRVVTTLNNNNEKNIMEQNYSLEFHINGRTIKQKNVINQVLNLLKNYIDDFCTGGKRYDHFERVNSSSSVLREKKHQQALFIEHQNMENESDLLFYDMELSLPKPQEKTDEYNTIKLEIGTHITGAPDCLAVRLENGVVTKIVLVEVKSTSEACTGDHGIKKHDEDFNKIIKCSYYRKFIVESMKETLCLYARYGLCGKISIPDNIGEKEDDFEILYFFTHKDVINWTVNSRNDNKDNLKKYKELYSQNPQMFIDYSNTMKKLLGKDYD